MLNCVLGLIHVLVLLPDQVYEGVLFCFCFSLLLYFECFYYVSASVEFCVDLIVCFKNVHCFLLSCMIFCIYSWEGFFSTPASHVPSGVWGPLDSFCLSGRDGWCFFPLPGIELYWSVVLLVAVAVVL